MTSRTTERFRRALRDLPQQIREQAATAYRRYQENPHHPSLRIKQVYPTKPTSPPESAKTIALWQYEQVAMSWSGFGLALMPIMIE
jgi:hypothetical protein